MKILTEKDVAAWEWYETYRGKTAKFKRFLIVEHLGKEQLEYSVLWHENFHIIYMPMVIEDFLIFLNFYNMHGAKAADYERRSPKS